jgi:hypothetical protein
MSPSANAASTPAIAIRLCSCVRWSGGPVGEPERLTHTREVLPAAVPRLNGIPLVPVRVL